MNAKNTAAIDTESIYSAEDAYDLFYHGRGDSDEKLEEAIGTMGDKSIEESIMMTIGVVFAREYRNIRKSFDDPTELTDAQLARAFSMAIPMADRDYCISGGMYGPCLRNAFAMACDIIEEQVA